MKAWNKPNSSIIAICRFPAACHLDQSWMAMSSTKSCTIRARDPAVPGARGGIGPGLCTQNIATTPGRRCRTGRPAVDGRMAGRARAVALLSQIVPASQTSKRNFLLRDELASGRSLQARLDRGRHFSVQETVSLASACSRAWARCIRLRCGTSRHQARQPASGRGTADSHPRSRRRPGALPARKTRLRAHRARQATWRRNCWSSAVEQDRKRADLYAAGVSLSITF